MEEIKKFSIENDKQKQKQEDFLNFLNQYKKKEKENLELLMKVNLIKNFNKKLLKKLSVIIDR